MNGKTILLLAADGPSTRAVYHALRREFGQIHVVLETRQTRFALAQRRLRKLGPLTVTGQMAFCGIVLPFLKWLGRSRIREIRNRFRLHDAPLDQAAIVHVSSVNSDQAREALRRFRPDVVVVNGTRILGPSTLSSVSCPVLNMHAGITPRYRGVHGGYWALAENRPGLVGTTVHVVDRGIDTGDIVDQVRFAVSVRDSFATYPYLHVAFGLPLLISAVRSALQGTLSTRNDPPALGSQLRYHPTLWGYLFRRIRSRVR